MQHMEDNSFVSGYFHVILGLKLWYRYDSGVVQLLPANEIKKLCSVVKLVPYQVLLRVETKSAELCNLNRHFFFIDKSNEICDTPDHPISNVTMDKPKMHISPI